MSKTFKTKLFQRGKKRYKKGRVFRKRKKNKIK